MNSPFDPSLAVPRASLVRHPSRRRLGRQGRDPRRLRLSVEVLEDRRLLASWSGDVFDTAPGVPRWTNDEVQHVTGDVRVPAGKTLTIQPGTIIQFNYGDFRLTVDGTLNAAGTTASPVIFTSIYDNSPTGGTDDAGRGYWGSIQFGPSSTANVMDHAEVRYGGWATEPLVVTAAPLTMSNSLVSGSYRAAMKLDLAARPVIRNTSFVGNFQNVAIMGSGSLPSDNAWDNAGIVYQLSGIVTIPAGKTLTIGPGQVVKNNGSNVIVDGTLQATGTAEAPVTFTSYRDDSAGGDTNGDGPSTGFDGDWGAITFNPGSDASQLDHAVIRYGGYSGNVEAAVVIRADVDISNSTFRNSYNGAVRIIASNPTLNNDTWRDNVDRFGAPAFAVNMDHASRPHITNPVLIENDINGVLLDAGEVTTNMTWDNPDIVYFLFGDVTVAAGATLTIEPGQIVKIFGYGLIVHGTLHAVGTSSAPIIFTSYRDDTVGGDTNNDGATQGDSPDWNGVELRADSSDNVMDYTEVRFGGFDGAGLDYGAIAVAGSLTLSHSIVRESEHIGVLVEPNGVATLRNNLIVNNGVAGVQAQANATLIAVNNTIDGNGGRRFRNNPFFGTGIVLSSPTATLRNNLITNNDIAGIIQDGPANLTFDHNDVFNPNSTNGNYFGLADQTGANGNLSVDPKYFNRANLSFQLQGGSPVEDAGTSLGAPATDFFGNPRFDDPNIAGRGDDSGYDLGAIESQLVATSTVDLATLNVSGPTTGTQGMTATVHWTVKNVGTGAAAGPWSDAIYLSDTPVWTPDARFLKRVSHTGDLAAGESYDATTDVTLTNVLPGDHYFLVRGNDLNEVFEGLSTANNTGAAASPITFAMPTLTLNTPFHDQFTAAGQAKYYQITVAAGQTLSFSLQSAAGGGSTELYVSRGAIPSRSQFDFSGGGAIAASRQVIVPQTQQGTYYVLAYSAFGAAATNAFTLTAAQAEFGVQAVSPATVGNSGPVTLTIAGAKFENSAHASLIAPDNSVIAATSVRRLDATHLQATFNLAGKSTGSYGVRIAQGVETATAAGALTVTTGATGHLKVDFIVPGGVRTGRQGTVTVEYTNDGGADLPAPILIVTSTSPTLRFTTDVNTRGDTAEFLAINPTGDAGVLPPGARGSIDLNFVATTDAAANSIQFTLASQSSQADTTPLDWTAAKEKLRPPTVPTDAWDAIYANFMDDVGTTLGSFQAMLDRMATYLSRLGEYTGDEGRLLALEFQQAGAFGAIARRYQLGAFGRGMPDPTAISATTDEDGNVTILANNRSRMFLIQGNHTYRGGNGDLGVLTRQDGAYRLREPNGTIVAFRTDGRFDYTQDSNGNRLTANYTSGRLTSYTDNFGDTTTLTYNLRGRIIRATDPVGRQTDYAYDASGDHLLSVSDAQGMTQFSYVAGQGAQAEHAIQAITYPDGTHTTFTYDVRGRLTRSERDGGANVTHYSYDSAGGTTITDASNHDTTPHLNEYGQLARVQDALNNVTSYQYDSNHHLTQIVRPDGAIVSFVHDGRGNPTTTTNPLGQRVDATFDPNFNTLQSLRDASGNSLGFRTDARGNPTSIARPDGSLERFTYDSAGNIVVKVDQAGHATRFTYDAHNLLIRQDFSDGSHTDFTYDAHRNLTTATNSDGTTTYDYDPVSDRLRQVTYPNGRYLKFSYDSSGRRTESMDQGGFKVRYAYDSLGRLATVKDANDLPIAAYTYNDLNRLSSANLGNGTYATYEYDANGRVLSLVNSAPDATVLARFDYAYDALGRAISMTTTDGTTQYGYDSLGQLTSVRLPNGRLVAYQYDAVGNRLSVTDGGTTLAYVTNNMNQYTRAGDAQYTYDAEGNLASRIDATGTTKFGYDLRGQLTSIESATDSFAYVYDAVGNRISMSHNGIRHDYLVDPNGFRNVTAEYGANDQLVAHYTYGIGLTSRVDASNESAYYGFDASGNTAIVTGANGDVADRYTFLPFGETLSQTESISNPFRFGGQLGVMTDQEGNPLMMRARYYDSGTGRFTSSDPIGIGGGTNLYRYAGNNPVSHADPSGFLLGIDIATITMLVEQAVSAGNADAVNQLYLRALQEVQIINESGQYLGSKINARKLIQGLQSLTRPTAIGAPTGAAVTAGETIAGSTVVSTSTTSSTVYILESEAAAGGYSTTVGVSASQGVGASASSGFVAAESVASVVVAEVVAPAVAVGAPGIIGLYALKETADQLLPTETKPGAKLLAKCQELGFSTAGGACLSALQELRGVKYTQSVTPVDPNDLFGPLGFGAQHFVTPDQTFPYTILFENLPTASAPALVVKVTQQLDAKLDWATFELGDLGFGKYLVHVPAGRRFFHTRVDASDTRGEFVDVTAEFDPSTGLATWLFSSVDPATGALPEGVTDGFLPPDDSSGAGQGFVNYRIRPKAPASTGTSIPAQARVIFEAGLPDESFLDTPVFTNTFDLAAPGSSVSALPTFSPPTFTVRWSGTDAPGGAGIASYDVYVADGDGAFTLWLDDTTDTSHAYAGTAGHTYSFYSVATDNVGHQELVAPTAQAFTTARIGPRWQNSLRPIDVSADTLVSPVDALLVINELNSPAIGDSSGRLPDVDVSPPPYLDVNGDDRVSPVDALIVINFLNGLAEGEGASADGAAAAPVAVPVPTASLHEAPFVAAPATLAPVRISAGNDVSCVVTSAATQRRDQPRSRRNFVEERAKLADRANRIDRCFAHWDEPTWEGE